MLKAENKSSEEQPGLWINQLSHQPAKIFCFLFVFETCFLFTAWLSWNSQFRGRHTWHWTETASAPLALELKEHAAKPGFSQILPYTTMLPAIPALSEAKVWSTAEHQPTPCVGLRPHHGSDKQQCPPWACTLLRGRQPWSQVLSLLTEELLIYADKGAGWLKPTCWTLRELQQTCQSLQTAVLLNY